MITLKIVLCGGCLSNNIGGPAFYIAFVDAFKKLYPSTSITMLSKYPVTDKPISKRLDWKQYDLPTLKQLFIGVPLALLASLLKWLHLPYKWLFKGAFEPYISGDILVDLSGISFSDDRPGTGLLINSLWFPPAIASGIPIIKLSQAMGPFEKLSTNIVGKFFLSRMQDLVARGENSKKYLEALLPGHPIHCLPDMAFALAPVPLDMCNLFMCEHNLPRENYAVMGPSHVVDNYMKRKDTTNYVECMAAAAQYLLENSALHILLIPHEVKNTAEDDSSVCRAIVAAMPHNMQPRMHVVPFIEDPRLAKAVCAGAEVAIGSRFHFLIATLSSCVPSLAIAWSHKYAEMMRPLDQEGYTLQHETISVDIIRDYTCRLWHNREYIRETLREKVPYIIEQASKNALIVKDLYQKLAVEK